ncbi:MAG: hypothetical protein IPJ77_15925 [Planctomycetes bacterium]|nr:hypothetical protein [Planctomycetota bacterium]
METPTSPIEPPAPTPRARLPRGVLVLIVAVLVVGLLGAAVATCTQVHALSTPDFWSYVRARRADDALVRPIRGEGRVLARGGELALGAGDVFERPEEEREHETVEIVLKHGDDQLLRFRHALAYVFGDDGATRTALGFRTEELSAHPDLRARVRIGVEGFERLVGPDSARAGSLTYDVTLLAGGGESTIEFVDAQDHGDGELEDAPRNALDPVLPWSTVPEEGFVHRVRQRLYLSAARMETGSQSIGFGASEHTVNTPEYSYDVEVVVGSKRSVQHRWHKNTTLTWNGATK